MTARHEPRGHGRPASSPPPASCAPQHGGTESPAALSGPPTGDLHGGGWALDGAAVIDAAAALSPLATLADTDPAWQALTAPTSWTAAATVEHIVDALLFYAGQIARRADRTLPVLRDGRAAPPREHLDNLLTAASVVAGQLRDLGGGRAWHPSGLADVSGWAAMAVTEILVHGHDTARAAGVALDLPEQLCAPTVARAFPWVDPALGPAPDLLLAVTGRVRVRGVPQDPRWWWQSAPLSQWNGRPRRRDVPPAWK